MKWEGGWGGLQEEGGVGNDGGRHSQKSAQKSDMSDINVQRDSYLWGE